MLTETLLIHAAAVQDAAGVRARPGAVLVHAGLIVAAGRVDDVRAAARGYPAQPVEYPDCLILPALVNAHAHLDLTLLGPRPHGGSFIDWVSQVIAEAPREDTAVREAVARGVDLSRNAGVGHIGDIARAPAAALALRESDLAGVSFLECFGIGLRAKEAADELATTFRTLHTQTRDTPPAWRLGLQPHAPYSTGMAVYEMAAELARELNAPLSTHLAETREEIEFVRDGEGPFADLLRRLGKWDNTLRGTDKHPVEHLQPVLQRAPWLLAHCNYVDDEHIELLTRVGASVAYCPIASEYFGHRGHRYRDMLSAGVNVCLGTDSILCQPPDEPQPLGILPQMRRLYQRDRTDPPLLLRMATIHGAKALGLDTKSATLAPGAPAKLIMIPIDDDDPRDPLLQALTGNAIAHPVGQASA